MKKETNKKQAGGNNKTTSAKPYEKMNRKELYEVIKSKGYKGTSRFKKAQLLELLTKDTTELSIETGTSRKPETAVKEIPAAEKAKQEGAKTPIPEKIPVSIVEPDAATERQEKTEEKQKEPGSVYVDWGYPLPDSYGIDRISAAAKDPNWIFVHWDLSGKRRQEVAEIHGPDIFSVSRWHLRLVDVGSGQTTDFPVNFDSANWYLPVDEDKTFRIQIGIITPEGSFILFAQTSEIRTPRSQPTGNISEQWMVTDEHFQRFLRQAGDPEASGLSSSELAAHLRARLSK